jgi:hypothetical protein
MPLERKLLRARKKKTRLITLNTGEFQSGDCQVIAKTHLP